MSNNKVKVKDPEDPTSLAYKGDKTNKKVVKKNRQKKSNSVKTKKGKKDGNNNK